MANGINEERPATRRAFRFDLYLQTPGTDDAGLAVAAQEAPQHSYHVIPPPLNLRTINRPLASDLRVQGLSVMRGARVSYRDFP